MKYQSRNSRMALPREARELSRLNSLHEGLGLEPVIGFQGVSAAAPKPIGPCSDNGTS